MEIALNNNYMDNPKIFTDYNDLLSVNDLSKIFNVSKQTIYKELHNGKFGQPIQIGRAYKIPKTYIVQRYFNVQ